MPQVSGLGSALELVLVLELELELELESLSGLALESESGSELGSGLARSSHSPCLNRPNCLQSCKHEPDSNI